jgi:hypothetical protein
MLLDTTCLKLTVLGFTQARIVMILLCLVLLKKFYVNLFKDLFAVLEY